MVSKNAQSVLASVLENTVIPWIKRDGVANILTAYPKWHAGMDLPDGMTVTHKPLRGKRKAARGGRAYGAAAVVDAQWPEDSLCSARTPKLCFVLAGPMSLQVADYMVHCLRGHGLLLPAGIPYANTPVWERQGIYELLQMMPYHGGLLCWFTRRWRDAADTSHVMEQTYSVPHSQAAFYLNQLAEEAIKPAPHQQLILDSLLKIVLTLLLRELQQLPVLQTGEISPAADTHLSGKMSYSITQAQKYIEINLREPLTIGKVARYVCMSRTVFTAQFRAKTGKTFTRYVQDLRLEEARKLLHETDLGVRHVAAAVGLKPNRMRELFHERENVSPQEFRQRHRENQ
jgi:AraC-like DNA-binding protein